MKKVQPFFLLFFSLCILCQYTYGQKDVAKTVYFKPNSYAIEKKYYKSLDLIAKYLKADNVGYLKIFGYADKHGSNTRNLKLSEKRANAVYTYLTGKVKIDTAKLYITWLGDTEDGYDLHFPAANTRKRCVDIWLTFFKREEMRPPLR